MLFRSEHVVATGMLCKTPKAKVTFNISDHPTRIALVEELLGRSGWLILQKLRIESFDSEEHLLFSAFDDDGKAIDQEACVKLFNCTARVDELLEIGESEPGKLHANADRHAQATVSMALERNNELFREERERLDRWAEDSVLSAEKELSDIKEQIKVQSRMARQAPTLDEQYAIQERIKELEKKKRAQRNRVFEVEDEITEKRDKLIQGLERRMQQQTETVPLFVIRWSVI